MSLLFFTDLHMDYVRNAVVTAKKEHFLSQAARDNKNLDAVIFCGDNAEYIDGLKNHRQLFGKAESLFDAPIGFVCGNHDLWGDGAPSMKLLWYDYRLLAKEYGLTYLELENLVLPSGIIAGTYGHYDYSLGKETADLSRNDFVAGTAVIGAMRHFWNDNKYMDWEGRSDEEVCQKLVSGFEKRAAGAAITISHTAPSKEAIGWPWTPEQDFLGAFSGSSTIGEAIKRIKPKYHICGHTHYETRFNLGETQGINIGSDYKAPAYLVLDTNSNSTEIKRAQINLE